MNKSRNKNITQLANDIAIALIDSLVITGDDVDTFSAKAYVETFVENGGIETIGELEKLKHNTTQAAKLAARYVNSELKKLSKRTRKHGIPSSLKR